MEILLGILLAGYGVGIGFGLGMKNRPEYSVYLEGLQGIPGYRRWFAGLAAVLLGIKDKWPKSRGKTYGVTQELRVLEPGLEGEKALNVFRVNRLTWTLLILFCGILICLCVLLSKSGGLEIQKGSIRRGDYLEEDQELLLEVAYGGGEKQRFQMLLGAQDYSTQEAEEQVELFMEELPRLILQGNESLEKVKGDLLLLDYYEGYPFMVSWYCSPSGYLSEDGTLLKQVKEPVSICLELLLTYEGLEWEKALYLTLEPGEVDATEQARTELQSYLMDSEEGSRTASQWQLPQEWQGERLSYEVIQENSVGMLFLLFVAAGFGVFLLSEKELHDRYLERQKQLKMAYPELVHKILLYLGAGMTIRGSLEKIREEYRQACGAAVAPIDGRKVAFEEVCYVCQELRTGVPEVQAYERWGKRTGLQEYIQLTTLLVQNLQKGNGVLVERLREETQRARREYLRQCKKMSEEAGTKLLGPLMMMLVVVMLMILIPAFSASGI